MRVIEAPKHVGPLTVRARCPNKRCAALLEFSEAELRTELGDRPFDSDSKYIICPFCQGRIWRWDEVQP